MQRGLCHSKISFTVLCESCDGEGRSQHDHPEEAWAVSWMNTSWGASPVRQEINVKPRTQLYPWQLWWCKSKKSRAAHIMTLTLVEFAVWRDKKSATVSNYWRRASGCQRGKIRLFLSDHRKISASIQFRLLCMSQLISSVRGTEVNCLMNSLERQEIGVGAESEATFKEQIMSKRKCVAR